MILRTCYNIPKKINSIYDKRIFVYASRCELDNILKSTYSMVYWSLLLKTQQTLEFIKILNCLLFCYSETWYWMPNDIVLSNENNSYFILVIFDYEMACTMYTVHQVLILSTNFYSLSQTTSLINLLEETFLKLYFLKVSQKIIEKWPWKKFIIEVFLGESSRNYWR